MKAIVARVVPATCGDFGSMVELDFISEELGRFSLVMQEKLRDRALTEEAVNALQHLVMNDLKDVAIPDAEKPEAEKPAEKQPEKAPSKKAPEETVN